MFVPEECLLTLTEWNGLVVEHLQQPMLNVPGYVFRKPCIWTAIPGSTSLFAACSFTRFSSARTSSSVGAASLAGRLEPKQLKRPPSGMQINGLYKILQLKQCKKIYQILQFLTLHLSSFARPVWRNKKVENWLSDTIYIWKYIVKVDCQDKPQEKRGDEPFIDIILLDIFQQ